MADRIVSIGPGAGLYAAWQYQALITITNPVAQANFQHKLLLSWMPGMRSDFSDIRFTRGDGTDCPYWIRSDSVVTSVSCEVWIKIPTSSQYAILMFWGNGACSSGASVSSVFDFGDDFASYTASQYTSYVPSGAQTITPSNGKIRIQNYGYMGVLYRNDKNTRTYGWYSAHIIPINGSKAGISLAGQSLSSLGGYAVVLEAIDSTHFRIRYYKDGVATGVTGATIAWDPATEYRLDVYWSSGGIQGYINGTPYGSYLVAAGYNPATYTSGYAGAYVYYEGGYFNDIYIRYYAATEPTLFIAITMPNPENNRCVWTDGNVEGECSFGVNYTLTVPTSGIGGIAQFGVNYALAVKGDLAAIVPFTVRYGFIADGRVVRPTQSSLVVSGSCSRNMATRMWTAKVKYAKAVTGGIGSALFDTNIEIYIPDHNGVSRCVFVGYYPSQTATLAPANDSEEFTGYDYAMKLSGRVIPDDLLSLLAPDKQNTANYQRLDYDSVVTNFTVGRTVKGLISEALGKIVATQGQWLYGTGGESYLVPVNAIILTDIVGTFQDLETIMEIGSPGQALVNGGAFIPLDFGPELMYPEDWVRAILGGDNKWRSETGIYPYRINPVVPVVTGSWTPKPYDSWDFPEDITRDQGIQMLSDYHNFIHLVKWKDVGLGGMTPCEYWVHQDDIDNADDYALTEHRGLSLPAAATVTATDQYLQGTVRMTIAGEGKRNQILIRCQDADGNYFTNARSSGITESAGVYYGQEIPNTYYKNDQNLVSQADCDAAAALLYAYMSLRVLTYTAVFAKRVDLEYLQKMTFSGLSSRGIPDDTYRIIGITPSWAAAAIFVEVTLIPDTQFKASMNINKIYTNSTIAVRNIVRDELAKLGKPELGTFTGYNSNLEAELYTEKGIKMVVRDGSA